VLADRMAALLAGHEPGWKLPRPSALARRFNVSLAEVEAVIRELTGRDLLRSSPDGQLYRCSPAEYFISLEGIPGLTSRVDPMGSDLVCEGLRVSWRRAPEAIAVELGLAPGDTVCVVRYKWTANNKAAAMSMTYLPEHLASLVTAARPAAHASGQPAPESAPDTEQVDHLTAAQPGAAEAALSPADVMNVLPLTNAPGRGPQHAASPREAELAQQVGQARAVRMEMQPPPPSVARILRLGVGQPAAMVTARFDDPVVGAPVAVTIAILRPELFSIVIESATAPGISGDNDSFSAWSNVAEDWES